MSARGGRGGRGGGRGGRGGFNPARPGTVQIAGMELNWDISGLELQKGPTPRFPDAPPPLAPPPTADESDMVHHHQVVRDRIHEGPFYTILNDGMRNGLKRKAHEIVPTEASLFNPFTDNETFTSKYLKVRRRIPKLDERPYVANLFPPELRSVLEGNSKAANGDANSAKRRKMFSVSKISAVSQIDRMINAEEGRTREHEARDDDDDEDAEEEDEEEDEKPDAVDEDDRWSAVSTDSEESDDDYNAEQYFDNGEDDDIDDADPYDNTYE